MPLRRMVQHRRTDHRRDAASSRHGRVQCGCPLCGVRARGGDGPRGIGELPSSGRARRRRAVFHFAQRLRGGRQAQAGALCGGAGAGARRAGLEGRPGRGPQRGHRADQAGRNHAFGHRRRRGGPDLLSLFRLACRPGGYRRFQPGGALSAHGPRHAGAAGRPPGPGEFQRALPGALRLFRADRRYGKARRFWRRAFSRPCGGSRPPRLPPVRSSNRADRSPHS